MGKVSKRKALLPSVIYYMETGELTDQHVSQLKEAGLTEKEVKEAIDGILAAGDQPE